MEENQSQNETPNLSKKSEEINDINDSPDNQAKDTSQSNITNDLLPDVRKNYLLYDNKICTGEDSGECRDCLSNRLKTIGYEITIDRGDYKE